ncbi:MAG: peptide deformylase [Arcobacteraceae bacterium]|nr:peptide deformylase [Arcobacteraceae bacterium]
MVQEIVIYPNPILRKKSQDVVKFDKELHTLLDDMNETMLHYSGVGLAAVQIGVLQNILIINLPVENKDNPDEDVQLKESLIEAINPVIMKINGEQIFNEGCLSIPGINEDITRAQHIVVEYFNRDGVKQTMEAEDFLAVAWQHEMEHLTGHVFIEHLSFLKRKKFEKEWKRKLKVKHTQNNKL